MSNDGLTGNRLLDALPEGAPRALLSHSIRTTYPVKALLFRQAEPIDAVEFPVTAVLSLMRLMEDGSAMEVALIGNEGMAGLLAVVGDGVAMNECVCQVAGDVLAIPASELRIAFKSVPTVQDLCVSYSSVMLDKIGQNVVCSGMHTAGQRVARWLLMVRDRVGRDQFEVTHDLLAGMLGVRRASVTEVFERLRHAEVISTRRGHVKILDRRGLEHQACECYSILKELDDRVPIPARAARS